MAPANEVAVVAKPLVGRSGAEYTSAELNAAP